MAERSPVCSKCQGQMELGHRPDYSYGAILVGSWVEGAPEKGLLGSLKIKGKRQFPISTYRCSACGYLESYAHAKVQAS
jgi:hypothetical protein